MYVGIDIGGTKTLVATLDAHGVIQERAKFPTPKKYDDFLLELRHTLAHFKTPDYKAAGVGVPGRLDRRHGRLLRLGNLPWKNEPIQADCERVLGCPVVIENDANLAGLSEAMLHPDKARVLYVTLSTGIGTGFVYQQRLEPALLDSEGGHVLAIYKDKLVSWEKFASGKAIFEHFGKQASDIPASDKQAWGHIARNIAIGLVSNIAIAQPDLIIIGGSIGAFFDRYGELLKAELDRYKLPVVHIPLVVKAQRPEEAVIYGCYDLAKQVYGNG